MGERALRRHDPAEAIERLDRALDQAPDFPRLELFAASEALATAWRRQGNDLAALRVLEAAAQRRPRLTDAGFLIGAFGRLRILTGLARLYRQLGRTNDAVSIEEEVLGSLRFADPDHPLVLRITEGRRLEVELDPDRRLDDWTASSSRASATTSIGEGGANQDRPRDGRGGGRFPLGVRRRLWGFLTSRRNSRRHPPHQFSVESPPALE